MNTTKKLITLIWAVARNRNDLLEEKFEGNCCKQLWLL